MSASSRQGPAEAAHYGRSVRGVRLVRSVRPPAGRAHHDWQVFRRTFGRANVVSAFRRTVIAAVCALTSTAGCVSKTEQRAPASNQGNERSALQSVALPDLSSAAPAVQSQLRAQYASLQSATQNAGTPAADLAAAYGQMGMLFLAAEYFDPAESSL